MSNAENTTTRLGELTALLQEQYMNEFIENSYRHGRVTERLIKPRSSPVKGDGVTIHFETAKGDTIRMSREPLKDFNAPRAFQATKLKVRFSENASENDFSEISGSGQVSHLDLIEDGDGAIVDMAERVARQIREDYSDKMALHQHLDQTAKVAEVSGTPKENDSWYMDGAGAYTSGDTTMRCVIEGGPLAAFKEGRVFDIYNGDTLRISNVEVTDFNADDNSVGFKLTANSSEEDFDGVADGDDFYLSGEKDAGMFGYGAWFTRPTSGESFIGGVDRSAVANRYLIASATREGATAEQIAKSHFNDAANKANFVHEEELAVVCLSDLELHQAMRDAIGEAAFIQFPVGDSRAERFANFGSMGLNFQHPMFGTVKMMADPLAVPNTVRFLVPSDWELLYYGFKGLQFMPASDGQGVWYRMESDTPGNGKSKYYKCDAYTPGVTTICKRPKRQVQILNVTAG